MGRRRPAAGPAGPAAATGTGARRSRASRGTPAFHSGAIGGVLIAIMIARPRIVPFVQFLQRSGISSCADHEPLQASFRASIGAVSSIPTASAPRVQRLVGRSPPRAAQQLHRDHDLPRPPDDSARARWASSEPPRARAWFWLACAAFVLACMFGAPFVAPWSRACPASSSPRSRASRCSCPCRSATSRQQARACCASARSRTCWRRSSRSIWRSSPDASIRISSRACERAGHADGRVSALRPRAVPHRAVLRLPLAEHRGARARRGRAQPLRLRARLPVCCCVSIRPRGAGTSTVLTFNSLKYNFDDPLNALLGIRWFIEHNDIDIIKWGIFKETEPGVKQTGSMPFRAGAVLQRTCASTPSRSGRSSFRSTSSKPAARTRVSK
jgi:hypothetical protein